MRRVVAADHAGVGQHVELVVEDHRRRRVGIALGLGPDHGVCARQVALAAQPNRHEPGVLVSAHDEHQVVLPNRLRDGVRPEAGALPDQLARLEVVAAHFLRGAHHHLLCGPEVDHQRRGPVRLLVPADPPDLLAGLLVEHDHEGVAFVIEHQDELVAGEHRAPCLRQRPSSCASGRRSPSPRRACP